MKKTVPEIETPGVLVDVDRLHSNIQRVRDIAASRQVSLRPHIKTHKCPEIGRLQLNNGAAGITASKTDEALVFVKEGFRSLTVAYPIIAEAKLNRLLAASLARNADIRFIVDSWEGLEAISRAARKHDVRMNVFLKIDVGLHRCGLEEDDPLLLRLARKMERDPSLNLLGLLSHAGHVYGARNSPDVLKIARDECGIMGRIRKSLRSEGIGISEVSVGSTPTVLASDAWEGITEIRPGNYVFMDRTPLRMGLIEPEQIALSVLATVISANSAYFIIDAGSKVLSSDTGAHGMPGAEGYGLAYPAERFQEQNYEMILVKLSEEHGFIARKGFDLRVGSKVRIIPNHSCSVANLADSYIILKDGKPVDQWQVAARGKVR